VNETFLRAGHLDTALVRRLAVLKIWIENYGLIATAPGGETEWKPGHEGSVFDVDRWLRRRGSDEFDTKTSGRWPSRRPRCLTWPPRYPTVTNSSPISPTTSSYSRAAADKTGRSR
jgi:hypothetical protein